MSQAVAVEIEKFTNGVVKEIGLYGIGICIGIAFKPPYSFSNIISWDKKCKYSTEKVHMLEWNSGTVPYNYLPRILDLICKYRSYEVQKFFNAARVILLINFLDGIKQKRAEYLIRKTK